jgi:hypothetical protein
MDDVESRALYLTVKKLAPLHGKFWDLVSEHMLSHFNIKRSATSVKLEWLRYSSAWWGFDERNCIQFGEHQHAERHSLYRCTPKNGVPPPLEWHYLSMPLRKAGDEGSGLPKERKPRVLKKNPEKAQSAKRKRYVVLEDSDSEDQMPRPANKRRQMSRSVPVPPPTVGGKYVETKEVFATPTPQSPLALKTIVEAHIAPTPSAHVGPAAAAALVAARIIEPSPAPVNEQLVAVASAPTVLVNNGAIIGTVDDLFSAQVELKPGALRPAFPVDIETGTGGEMPISRFEGLVAHRREVKHMLRNIEPKLDWSEGPWVSAEELLWTGDEEAEWKATFGDA